jgi:PIN domain nuclease of toxin-antitoxin system
VIVLDTHAWIWLRSDPDRLSSAARAALDGERVMLATISCWELATLVRLGRIALDREAGSWVAQGLDAEPRVTAVPLDPEVAVAAGGLGESFPGDPADRIIYATALSLGCQLVTKDRRLRAFAPDRTLWD